MRKMQEKKNKNDELVEIGYKLTSVEPLDFSELSEIFGGVHDQDATNDNPDVPKQKGFAGGFICWCS